MVFSRFSELNCCGTCFSAYVQNLVPREEILSGNINISPKSKGVESMYLSESDSDAEADHEIMEMNSGNTPPILENVTFFISLFVTIDNCYPYHHTFNKAIYVVNS